MVLIIVSFTGILQFERSNHRVDQGSKFNQSPFDRNGIDQTYLFPPIANQYGVNGQEYNKKKTTYIRAYEGVSPPTNHDNLQIVPLLGK